MNTCARCGQRIRHVTRGALRGWADDNGDLCCPGTATPHEPEQKGNDDEH